MTEVPPAIHRMLDATNSGDHDAFVAAFTPDAVLVDWGKVFSGRDGIASWDESDNIGRHARFRLAGAEQDDDIWVVTLEVTGGGFNGMSDFRFTLTGDLIARLEIAP